MKAAFDEATRDDFMSFQSGELSLVSAKGASNVSDPQGCSETVS